jgi:hypothetical protein
MLRRTSVVLSVIGLVLAVGIALAAEPAKPAADKTPGAAKPPAPKPEKKPQPTFNTPAEAGPDFELQGEYAGTLQLPDGDAQFGAQIIARGNGKFHAVGYPGGLPGAGWNGGDKFEADGECQDGKVAFRAHEGGATATLAQGVLSVTDENGKALGALKKIARQSPTLGVKPPAGAVVLFDGTSVDAFLDGRMSDDKLLMEGATSKQKFGSCQAHLEFRLPFMPFSTGQARANSGFYVQGRYEIQILDSFGLEGLDNECGGIYKASRPAVNMCLPPLAWQTYDVDFTAAKFEDGKKVADACVTVRHNGVVIHDNLRLPAVTPGGKLKDESAAPGPVFLQNHSNPVRFRNVWVLETGK